MKDLMDRLGTKLRAAMTSEDEVADVVRLQEEWETARPCMDICFKADNHLKDNVSTVDNYATGDAVQIMVSTNGKIIHGKNRGLGWRTRQIFFCDGPCSALHALHFITSLDHLTALILATSGFRSVIE